MRSQIPRMAESSFAFAARLISSSIVSFDRSLCSEVTGAVFRASAARDSFVD